MEAKRLPQIQADNSINIEAVGMFLQHSRLTQVIKDAKDKDLVLFLGLTASGKSTCISYLLGAKIDSDEHPSGETIAKLGENQPEVIKGKKLPQIGMSDRRSCTLYSEIFYDDTSGLAYCDTAGFLDTRSIEGAREYASLSTELAVQSAKKIKAIILVLDWDIFQRTVSTEIESLMCILGQLLVPPYTDMKDSLIFLINKIPHGRNIGHFKYLVELYYKLFSEKMDLAKNNMATSVMDTVEFQRLNRIALMLNLLQSQLINHPENVILMNVFDNGEKRETIQQLLLSRNSVIPKEKFNFKTYDEKRQRFDTELDKLADKGKQLIDDYFSLSDKKEALEKNEGSTKASQAYYSALTNFLKTNDAKMFSSMKSGFIELTNKEIERVAKEKQECTQKITSLNEKNRLLLTEKNDLDTTDSALIYEDTFYEPLAPAFPGWDWSKNLWYAKNQFIYPTKVPFLRDERIGNGSWYIHKRNETLGICELIFTSSRGEDANATFRVFAEKKRIPGNALRLEQIEQDLPKNANKIIAYENKLKQLEDEENTLNELLKKTNAMVFETSDQQRETIEKQFRERFTSSELSDVNSCIYLFSGALPHTLEKGHLYLRKIVGPEGTITITTQMSNEPTSRILSKSVCDELQCIENFPAFPSTSKPVILHRAQQPSLFQSIATICGYALVDINQQKNNNRQAITVLKTQIKQAEQAISEQQAGFKLIEDLSGFFEGSSVTKNFLVRYQEYQAWLKKEMTVARLHMQRCHQQLEQFDVHAILDAKTPANLETLQTTLESILYGISDDGTDALLKAQAFWSLCKAYQKNPAERSLAVTEAFNQFLKMAHKDAIQPILQSIVFHHLCKNDLNEPALTDLLSSYIKNFGCPAPDENGNTWLHDMVIRGNIPGVQLLLQHPFDTTVKNVQGQTPFFLAALNKQPILVKILLAHGKLDFKPREELLYDANQNYLLSYLLAGEISSGLLDIVEMLTSFGATISVKMLKDSDIWHQLVKELTPEKETFLNTLDKKLGPFYFRWDKTTVAYRLLAHLLKEINVAERAQCLYSCHDQEGTLLQFTLRQYAQSPERIKAILGLFIAKDSAMDGVILATCIQAGQADIVTFLLGRWKNPLNLNIPLPDGKTFLGLAIEVGSMQCVEVLLKYHANSDQLFSYHFSQATLSRKGFATITDDALRYDLNLSTNFVIGTAVDDGGCFFDSFAQVVNALEGSPLHTEKSLREQCYQYYRQNPDQVEQWHQADYKGTAPSYDKIQHSGSQAACSGKIIWGRPQVEGMILCRMLDLDTVHVAEVMPNPDNAMELTVGYYKITPDGYQSIHKTAKPVDSPFLVVSKNDLHFIPVLKPALISPLCLCVFKKQFPILEVLLRVQTKVDLRSCNEKGQTVFHAAALMGNLAMLKTLESKLPESDKVQWLTDTDKAGNTAFMLTIKYGYTDCMQWIVEICEKYSQGKNEKSSHWNTVLQKSNHRGQTAMSIAIKNSNTVAVEFCFARGSASFWQHETEGNKVLTWVKSNNRLPQQMTEQIRQSKITHCIELVTAQLKVLLSQDSFHKAFLAQWLSRLEKVLNQSNYKPYQDALIEAPMGSVQKMAEQLAKNMVHEIRAKFSEKHKELLQDDVSKGNYHAWDQVLHAAIEKTLSTVPESTITKKTGSNRVLLSGQAPLEKTDKHRAFTRALKEALRNYFYVSRALYEGKVLMNDEGFNAFKAAYNIASPVATQICAALTQVNVGVVGSFVSAALELVTRLKDAKYQCEAGRFIQAFGACQPDAIEKCEKDISIDHEKLKEVAETLYRRYRDQIEQCTVSKEADISLRLAKTDGIYVLANIMADRIFQHMIKKGSIKVDDDRTITEQFLDWVKTLGANNDIYYEISLMSLPERCIMAILHETVGEDKDAHVRTDTWLKNGCKTEDMWMAGGILVKTGLKLQSNAVELYIRKGNATEESLHARYGYCYLSPSMVNLQEIKKRGFVPAEVIQVDQFADSLSETDKKAMAECRIF